MTPTRTGRTGGATFIIFIMLLILSGWELCPGAQAASSKRTRARAEAPVTTVTLATVQAQLTQVAADTTLSTDTRAALTDLFQQTLGQLKQADEAVAKAADYEKRRTEAPAQLAAIRTELAQPVTTPTLPVAPAGATADTLQPLLAQQQTALDSAQKEYDDLDGRIQNRTNQQLELQKQLTEARQALDDQRDALYNSPPVAGESRRVTQARRWLAIATRQALEKQVRMLEQHAATMDATGDLQIAKRDKAARARDQAEELVQAWQDLVDQQRQTDAENAALAARRAAAQANPAVRSMAELNQRYAEERAGAEGLANRISEVVRQKGDTDKELDRIRAEFESVKDRDKAAGLSSSVGLLLRQQRRELPDPDQLRDDIAQRQDQIAETNLKLMELMEKRSPLANGIEREVAAVVRGLPAGQTPEQLAEISGTVRELLKTRIELLDALTKDYDNYLLRLVEFNDSQQQLAKELATYLTYIDERVLWIRSTRALCPADLMEAGRAARWLTDPAEWRAVLATLGRRLRGGYLSLAGIVVLLGLVGLLQRRMRERIRALGRLAEKEACLRLIPTMESLLLTGLFALYWPAIAWLAGWALTSQHDMPELGKALGAGLRTLAGPWLAIEWLRQFTRDRGLAEAHFGWPASALDALNQRLQRLRLIFLPLLLLTIVMNSQSSEEFKESLGRLAMIGGLIALAVAMHRSFHPQRGAFAPILRLDSTGWIARLRPLFHPVMVGIPAVLALIAALGFSYTTLQLGGHLLLTLALALVLMLLNELLHRWLLLAHHRLALNQASQPAADSEGPSDPHLSLNSSAAPPAETSASTPSGATAEVDLAAIDRQTRRIVKSLIGFALVLGLWLIWVDVLPALGILRTVPLWKTTAPAVVTATGAAASAAAQQVVTVTLADLALALGILVMMAIAGGNIPGLLEITVLQRLRLENGVRFAITTISRYVIVTIGVIMALGTIHIGWAKVQWLAAAMTVGLGFGLQEIFANFVSGLIILFERPMRVGDLVTVKDTTGTVSRIQMRATTITDGDRRELIVPNKEFITGQLINWTLSDTISRVVVSVVVAFGSNPGLARQIMLDVARANPHVMTDPAPAAALIGFTDNAFDLKLYVHIPRRDVYLEVVHDLYTAIERAFNQAGIEIAFPRRDVHLELHGPLPVQMVADEINRKNGGEVDEEKEKAALAGRSR